MTKELRKSAIKAFCRFIDNYEGEMIIRNGIIFNTNGEIIYTYEALSN